MATPEEIFAAIAPQLVGDARIDLFLGLAATRLDATEWGIFYSEGIANLAAHFLTMANRAAAGGIAGGHSGTVTAKSAGDLSVSYGAVAGVSFSASDADLAQTSYGITVIALRNMLPGAFPSLVRPGC